MLCSVICPTCVPETGSLGLQAGGQLHGTGATLINTRPSWAPNLGVSETPWVAVTVLCSPSCTSREDCGDEQSQVLQRRLHSLLTSHEHMGQVCVQASSIAPPGAIQVSADKCPGNWTLEGGEEALEACRNRVVQLKNPSAPP